MVVSHPMVGKSSVVGVHRQRTYPSQDRRRGQRRSRTGEPNGTVHQKLHCYMSPEEVVLRSAQYWSDKLVIHLRPPGTNGAASADRPFLDSSGATILTGRRGFERGVVVSCSASDALKGGVRGGSRRIDCSLCQHFTC